jgi:hypothetical protein
VIQMNNSYQFLHLETYAIKPKKGTLRPSAEAVARECQRAEQSFPHIKSPQKPELLYGIQPLDALAQTREFIKDCKDILGRKLRADAQIISFGVASIKVESTDENWESDEVKKWVKDTIEFLKDRFGDSFTSLVKHNDEQWIHVHICITPKLDENGSLDLNSFHPGLAAKRKVIAKTKSAKDHAYKEAMRLLQDEYYAAVSIKNGMLRYGAKRRRLTRKEWYNQKRYAKLVSNLFNEQASLISSLGSKLDKAKNMLTQFLSRKFTNKKAPVTSCKEL